MELCRGRPGLCRNKPLLYLPFGGKKKKKDSQKSVSLCQAYEIHGLQLCSESTFHPVTGHFSKADNAYLTRTSAKLSCDLIHRCAEYLVLLLNSAFGNDKRWVCGRWGAGLCKSSFTCLFTPLSGKVDSDLQGWPNVWVKLASLAAWPLTLGSIRL